MTNSQHRPGWDEIYVHMAEAIAARSRCSKAQVGAIIANSQNQQVTSSFNGPPRGWPLEGPCKLWCPRALNNDYGSDYGTCVSVHAEANSIAFSSRHDREGGTMYVTRAMCGSCAPQVANSGIARVVHTVTDDDMHRNPDSVEAFLRECGLEVVRWKW